MPLFRTLRYRLLLASFLLPLILSVASSPVAAQDQPNPKWDLFLGYQWTHPGGHVPNPSNPGGPSIQPPDMGKGAGGAVTYNFDPHWGLEGDVGHDRNDFGSESTFSAGPRLMIRTPGMNLFLHALLGVNEFNVKGLGVTKSGVGGILGGGMDLPLWPHVTIRALEADYVLAHQNFAEFAPPGSNAREPNLVGIRLRGGVLFNFGNSAPPTPPQANCSVQPTEVMVGEPVTATANTSNFNPKHTLNYSWSSSGGKVSGKETTASIDTNGLAGGSYTVTAHISDPKVKKGGEASCSATFAVKEPPKNPPTMSCTANPTSLQAGGTSSISCTCSSPDNVPVTVSGWTASAGSVSGNGDNATLNTTGASAGPITVSATCSDSRALSAPASTQVNVEAPPPPPPPQASKLSECDFSKMAKIGKPWRVDNECKAILDDVAKNLQQNAENRLVVVGNAEPGEKRKNLAAERAVNAKAYLSGGESKQGIDASRIETRTGGAGTMTAEFWIVPAGANFTGEGTQAVDESKVKPVPDHPHVAAKKKSKAH
jgi:hypothetical protein